MNVIKIEQDVFIAANREKVFSHLTGDVTSWWDHSFHPSPQKIVLEPELGGKFFEDMGDGDGAIYCHVTYLKKNEKLVMQGPMGMSGAVIGTVSWTLEEADGGTNLHLSHHVAGDVNEDTRLSYSGGWEMLLGQRLKSLVETGAVKQD